MSPHRDFDAARNERRRETEPVTFTLGGETFTCGVEPAMADALELADAPEPRDNEIQAVKAILRFVRALVEPEDRKRLDRMLARQSTTRHRFRRATHPVTVPDVLALGEYLAAEYAARPTGPSTASSAGRPTTGAASNGGSSSEASTSPPSG